MNFVQIEFLWFMAAVFAIYWAVPTRLVQNLVLLLASAIFYGWVHPWFLGLLVLSASIDYGVALQMKRAPAQKHVLLAISLVSQLGLLAYFKYTNFFLQAWLDAAHALGIHTNVHLLNILLPVGISFYTFQTLSYTIDVYRGDLEPRRNMVDYFLYVSFFPQLVAGPIERATHLLPQVERPRRFDRDAIVDGLGLAVWGGFKKVVIADTLAPYVDKVFIVQDPAGPLIWAGAVAFMMQLYADFSGYTDIARGTARMLGFNLAENFRNPYLASTTPEFWQRWHISLSFWIRDYLMVPLLGSATKLTLPRFIFATLVTFVVVGFWHGASWNFILFGLFHGFWMTVYTLVNRAIPERIESWPLPQRLVPIGFHLLAVSVPGSLLFRETHVARLWMYAQKSPFVAPDAEWVAASVVLGVTAAVTVPLVLAHAIEQFVVPRVRHTVWWWPLQTSGWATAAVAMFVFYRTTAMDFIYFQF